MERYAADGLRMQRDQAVKSALKAKVPIFEIATEFGLSDAEVGEIIKNMGPPKRDDLLDARNEPRGKEVRRNG